MGGSTKEYTPKQKAAIRRVEKEYAKLTKLRDDVEDQRDVAAEAAHLARGQGVQRQTLIDRLGSVGAVGNLLRDRPPRDERRPNT